jgi:hypothetical protein
MWLTAMKLDLGRYETVRAYRGCDEGVLLIKTTQEQLTLSKMLDMTVD